VNKRVDGRRGTSVQDLRGMRGQQSSSARHTKENHNTCPVRKKMVCVVFQRSLSPLSWLQLSSLSERLLSIILDKLPIFLFTNR
jgi:hypothetical protein